MKDKISVIIPVYNAKEYLDRCLKSVCCQTYKNLEIICIDDGSTDGSEKIVDEFAEKYENVMVIHQENQGESAARNRGLDCASGNYIAFVDCDDWLEADMYEKMVASMEQNQVQLAAAGYFMEYENKTVVPQNEYKIECQVFGRKQLFEYVYIRDKYRAVTSWLWCKLFKRELFEMPNDVIRFDESVRFGADLMVFIRYASKVEKAAYIDLPLYHYLQRDTSTSHSNNLDLSYEIVDVYLKMIEYCQKNKIEEHIIPWLQRFAVYRATLVAEEAITQKRKDIVKKCQEIMLLYEEVYRETNRQHTDRIIRYERLKQAVQSSRLE